ASRLATSVLATHYHRKPDDPGRSLADAVRTANRIIHEAGTADPGLAGMGTTCTAIVIHSGRAWCAHVGDSRCYLVRDGGILLMTEDHSSVMELVREGTISASEARNHPDKNVILRALGSHRDVEVAVWPRPFALEPGDRLLLCSDGLYDLATDDDILAAVGGAAPQDACDHLVELARARGAPDNVTVIVVAVPAGTAGDQMRITRPVPVVR
ncbi:MAG TPA: SpoIIE family protein phosphatase, partial [Gemmatimonadales bacterium]|nr:SpoIIE family protein phosphatase [Gemmatimonadales bacterium]